jgi:putative MFS transporter
LIAGTNNIVAPKATAEAVTPAFLFLAGCMVAVGLVCTFLGPETVGKPMSMETNAEPIPDPTAANHARVV